MTSEKRDLFSGIATLVLSISMYIGSVNMGAKIVGGAGPGFLPKLIATGLLVLSIILIISSSMKIRNTKLVDQNDNEDNDENNNIDIKTTALSLLALTLYVLLLDKLGFVIGSFLYLFSQMLILSTDKNRSFLVIGIVSVIAPVAVYLFFSKIFNIVLPIGLLG